jgi:hypothetical protein
MNQREAENLRKQAAARIILHPNGQEVMQRLQAERSCLRALVTPLYAWFERFAGEYRQRQEDLLALTRGNGDYWPASLYAQHVHDIAYHMSQAQDYLHATLFYLEEHETCHPLLQSLLDHLPEHEGIYGPLFLYTWMPVSAWVGDLMITWWDGPPVPEVQSRVRCFQTRGIIWDRHYRRTGLETLLHRWCQRQGRDPAQFSLVSDADGRSVSLEGYKPRPIEQLQAWTIHNHIMEWASNQPLPSIRLDEAARETEA